MVPDSLLDFTALDLIDSYRARKFSPTEIVSAVAARIAVVEDSLNALPTLCLERAEDEARASERRYVAGSARILEGVPFVAKDLLDTAGVRTSYGSALFADHVPNKDATAVARLRAEGAILVGKAATHEFGWGITTNSERLGPTRNPWALDRIPGGSSGGSATALAAGIVPLAIGSDTGGSIRMPASFCGVVGFKPSYGSINAAGVFALAPSLDHVGSMARNPVDAALFFDVMAGNRTSTVAEKLRETDRNSNTETGRWFDGRRIGVCRDAGTVALDPAVGVALDRSTDLLVAAGAQIVEVELPNPEESYDAFAVTLLAEALAEHRGRGLFPKRVNEYGSDVQARLALAAQLIASSVDAAQLVRRRLREQLAEIFRNVDLFISPVSAGPPPRHGEDPVLHLNQSVEFRRTVMPFVVQQDLAGIPACSVRAGFDTLDIPIGIQFSGPVGDDSAVLQAAHDFYEATGDIQGRWPMVTIR